VVVVQPHGPRAHQPGRDGGHARVLDEPPHRRQTLPVAEVLDERAVVVGAGPLGARGRVGEVGVDRLPGQRDVLR
jgi:hypothetical protein